MKIEQITLLNYWKLF